MPEVDRIGVVVPARDEADHVGACLAALAEAARHVTVPVEVVVVVNATLDATPAIARRHGARVLERAEPGVGAARAAGVGALLERHDPTRTWIATTDADSRVPPAWLEHHLHLAAAGAEVVLGTIRLAADVLPLHQRWWSDYLDGIADGHHRHVHGANLGFHAAPYLAVGGFADLTAHEDADLVGRLVGLGCRTARTVEEPVVTSARARGRAPAGVAADLRAFAAPAS